MKKLGLLVALLLCAVGAQAQDKFPSRPIRMIVATPPGGGVDINARYLAELVGPILGQKVLVVNRPGGNGAVGVGDVLHEKPDGYTLAEVWPGPITVLPNTAKLSYTLDDMTPIGQVVGAEPYVLCVKPDFPANDAKQFVALAKQNPGKYTYGNDGVGNGVNLAVEGISKALGIKLRAIPYGGSGETLTAFLGGQIDIYGGSGPPVLPAMKAGTAKCLLVTTAERSASMPDVMSVGDLGVPQAAAGSWNGIIGPKGMSPEVVAIINGAYRKAAESDKFKQFVTSRGQSVAAGTPEEFGKMIRDGLKSNGAIVASLGLQPK